jgi:hypothetical protein
MTMPIRKVACMKQTLTAGIRSKIHPYSFLQLMQWTILINFVYLLAACVPSSHPTSEELIKTRPPTFMGASTATFTTGTPSYILNGECDPISYGLEFSYNNLTWTTYAPGCVASAFSIPVTSPGLRKVYVRARTKLGFTPPGVATIRLILPPTSPAFQVVSAGHGGVEEDGTSTFTMGILDGIPTSTVNEKLDSNITGIVYAP